MVSKARLDLPDPDSPVNTISESLGNSSDTSLRLCSRAPRTTRRSATAVCFPGHESLTRTGGHVIVSGGTDKARHADAPGAPARNHPLKPRHTAPDSRKPCPPRLPCGAGGWLRVAEGASYERRD